MKNIITLTIVGSLSGLSFGYDTAVISGATLYLENDFPGITARQQEMVVSFALLGAALGALCSGSFADRYGRRLAIIFGDLLMIIGCVMMAMA